MTLVSSFLPLSRPDARILILGSMPGVASLQAQQYYAHSRNAFWPIIQHVYKAGRELLPYEERVEILLSHKIALWDVLENCMRPGSLDSSISDEVPNDLQTFIDEHPYLEYIFFNGKKARNVFDRMVLPKLKIHDRRLDFTTLPSTSPANASHNFHAKLDVWRQIDHV